MKYLLILGRNEHVFLSQRSDDGSVPAHGGRRIGRAQVGVRVHVHITGILTHSTRHLPVPRTCRKRTQRQLRYQGTGRGHLRFYE